ncbi:MAG: GIY-YIG nuclease family protein [candidate division Zixibacteria bacterium]|nr:GIY-YIG nuclease family protein [candidate division Zixibacteria bacterium]
MAANRNKWSVYLVRCCDESIYTGISIDVKNRVEKHNQGNGAKYTAQRRPVELIYQEQCLNFTSASRREIEIKRWSRERKEGLAAGSGVRAKNKSHGRAVR